MTTTLTRTVLLSTLLQTTLASTAQTQNALDFDGVDDEVTVANASGLIAGATGFSLACWVKPTPGVEHHGIAGLRDEAEADFYLLKLANQDAIEGRFRNSSGTAFSLTYTGLTMNTWQHLTLVYTGSELILYRDGVQVSSVAASGSITSTTGTFHIGNLIYLTDNFNLFGQIDEVGLWNTALSAELVECVASSSIDGAAPGLQLSYSMDQGVPGGNNTAISALTDLSGNINGTLEGFALTGSTSNFVAGPVIGFAVEGSLCEGGSYTFDGQALTTTGTYTATFTSSSGCDSTVVLTLVEGEVNTNVVQNGNTLISTATNATWQWVDCDNNNAPIPGATGQYYQATAVGSYAVIVDQGCTGMSACFDVTTIGIEERHLPLFSLWPVPVADILNVELARPAQHATLTILDMTGREVLQRTIGNARKVGVDVAALHAGAYFVRVQADGATRVVRFVRE